MKPRGRPPLDEDTVRRRIAEYCSRYGVTASGAGGLPAFPAGKRETPQHREWMVLYKALRRLEARQAAATSEDRQEALGRQKGRCPICREAVGPEDPLAPAVAARPPVVVHVQCSDLIRAALRIGPEGLERLRAHVSPAADRSGTGRKVR